MRNIEFRTLKPEEVEVRPQNKAKNSDTKILLLYIDSRAVTTLLDETVGNLNWKNEFYEADGLLFNRLSIWDSEKQEWISRSETGSESTIEQEKGKVSDTFKRCLSRFGVTELYSSPRIEVKDDGYGCTGYKVSEIAYDDNRKITHLVIVNRFGKEIARWDTNTRQQRQAPVQPQAQPVQAPKQAHTAPPQPQPAQTPTEGKTAPEKKNSTILFEFAKSEEQAMKDIGLYTEDICKFYDYYIKRADTWQGKFDPQALWMKWTKRKSA